jgi:MFS family permease
MSLPTSKEEFGRDDESPSTSCSSSETGVVLKPQLDLEEDGGRAAWMTLAGAFCAMFVQFGLNNAFGVFQAYYETHQLADHTSDAVGWLGGVQQFLFLAGGLVTGRLLDARGPHFCIVPGSILLTASLFITSVCTKYYHFMLGQSMLFGVGAALIFTPVIALPNQHFPRRRAMAGAIAISGSGLGGVCWPIILQRLIAQVGFGWALRISGFISAALLALACALVRPRFPPRKATPFLDTLKCFKDPNWLLLSFATSLSTSGCFMPSFYITLRATHLGAGDLAFYTISILLAASMIGRLGASVGDITGRFNLNIVSTACVGIIILTFWVPLRTMDQLLGFAVAYGPFFGLLFSLNSPCMAQISAPDQVGARTGLMFALNAPFNLVAVPIAGAIVSAHPGEMGFRLAGVFGGCLCLAGAGLMLAAGLRIDPRLSARL